MQEILQKVPDIIELIALGLMAIVIVATVASKFTKTTKDDELVLKCAGWIQKVIAFLPTIGVNARTKKLEDAYLELKARDEAIEVLNATPVSKE